jgi:hypothetical protein
MNILDLRRRRKNPSPSGIDCFGGTYLNLNPTHQEAGKRIGDVHQACARGSAKCTVTP